MGCGAGEVAEAVRAAAEAVAERQANLNELDRPIGDSDHGENLHRGFTAVRSALDGSVPDSPGGVVKTVATTLISTVGGAAGPLYGTAFLRAATTLGDKSELDGPGLVEALDAALAGAVGRGKAEVGDATMVDALAPAARVARDAADGGGGPADVLAAAAEAAEAGAESTVPLVARKGRASYLGERSAGHLDPGARSTAMILRAFAEAAR